MPIRIALVNDYEVVVRGLLGLLRSYTDAFEVVELDVGTSVATPCDIVLYDTFAQVKAEATSLGELVNDPDVGRVVVYSWNATPRRIAAAIERGAHGYLSKTLPAAELVQALVAIHQGEQVISPGRRGAAIVGDWPGREEGLTVREAEVIALITQGLSNNAIAERAGISINSVKSYVRTAYRKMGVTNRSNAVLWGVAHGFRPDFGREHNPEMPTN